MKTKRKEREKSNHYGERMVHTMSTESLPRTVEGRGGQKHAEIRGIKWKDERLEKFQSLAAWRLVRTCNSKIKRLFVHILNRMKSELHWEMMRRGSKGRTTRRRIYRPHMHSTPTTQGYFSWRQSHKESKRQTPFHSCMIDSYIHRPWTRVAEKSRTFSKYSCSFHRFHRQRKRLPR